MGQAKVRREVLRQAMLDELEIWLAPVTGHEVMLVKELQRLPEMEIPRASREELEFMRMQPRKCHVNCTEYARLDPERGSSVVHGWWRRADMAWVCHSVILRDSRIFCITPCPQLGDERTLRFVPDDKIRFHVEDEGIGTLTRDGQEFPRIVRLDPVEVRAQSLWVKARLSSGMEPHLAGDLAAYPGAGSVQAS